MERFKTYLAMAAMALTATVGLTSCEDEDHHESRVLTGEWYGDFGMYYTYETASGRTYTYDSYDTELEFYPDHSRATHGYGRQKDYYETGPYEYLYYYFNWEIDNGVIYLDYPHDRYLSTSINDYNMTDSHFKGYLYRDQDCCDSDEHRVRFSLRKMYDYCDWSDCYDTYYYERRRDNWYFSFNKSVDMDETDGKIISRGSRFTHPHD